MILKDTTDWQACEASEPLSGLFNRESQYIYYSTDVIFAL